MKKIAIGLLLAVSAMSAQSAILYEENINTGYGTSTGLLSVDGTQYNFRGREIDQADGLIVWDRISFTQSAFTVEQAVINFYSGFAGNPTRRSPTDVTFSVWSDDKATQLFSETVTDLILATPIIETDVEVINTNGSIQTQDIASQLVTVDFDDFNLTSGSYWATLQGSGYFAVMGTGSKATQGDGDGNGYIGSATTIRGDQQNERYFNFDTQMQLIGTVNEVSAPSGLPILGASLLGLFLLRRKKSA